MNILLTGVSGFVGSRALRQWKEKHSIVAIGSSLFRGELTETRIERLYATLAAAEPEVLFHFAGISDTSYAQQHPEESYTANVLLPEVLARLSTRIGYKMVFCSSDQVYNGCSGRHPHSETELLTPIGVYGKHKLEAEQRIEQISSDAVSLRLTWMYDLPSYRLRTNQNLLLRLLHAALTNVPIQLSTSDYRGVTYVRQVVDNLLAVPTMPGGVYNFGSENPLNVYETALAWMKFLGFGAQAMAVLQPVDGVFRNISMNCAKAIRNSIVFDSTVDGVRRCMRDYGIECSTITAG